MGEQIASWDELRAALDRVRRGFTTAVAVVLAVLLALLMMQFGVSVGGAPWALLSSSAGAVAIAAPVLVTLYVDRGLASGFERMLAARPVPALRGSDLGWLLGFGLRCALVFWAIYTAANLVILETSVTLLALTPPPWAALAVPLLVPLLLLYAAIPVYLLMEHLLSRNLAPFLSDGSIVTSWMRFRLVGPGVAIVSIAGTLGTLAYTGVELTTPVRFAAVTLLLYAVLVNALAQSLGARSIGAMRIHLREPDARGATPVFESVDEVGALARDLDRARRDANRSRDALVESEQRFRQFAEAASDWFYEVDADLRVTWVSENLERLLGVSAEMLLGMRVETLGDSMDGDDHEALRAAMVAREPYRGLTFRIPGELGAVRQVRISALPMFDADGVFAGYRGVGSDVTGLMAARDQLAGRNEELAHMERVQAVGQLTGSIAHDFNNLLTAVRGNLELALDEDVVRRDEELQSYLQDAMDAASRGSDLVARLMGLSRRNTATPEALDLPGLLEDLKPILRMALGRNIHLTVDVEAGAHCFAERSQLENALLNLVINARDAIDGDGDVYVRARMLEGGDTAIVEVEDTGPGIPDGIAREIFQAFYTTKAEGADTGLGLSTVQSFAQQSGGDVSLLAGAQGGARFLIRLPARAGRAPEQAAPLPSSATQAMLESLDQPRVLIVDDDDAVRHLVRRQVERLGFMASDLATATEALDTLAREERFDLLLSDVVLGTEIDGLELGMRAKALRPELLVVYMTGYTERSYELEGERWLSKPFTSRGLETVLRETLDRSDAGGKQSIH